MGCAGSNGQTSDDADNGGKRSSQIGSGVTTLGQDGQVSADEEKKNTDYDVLPKAGPPGLRKRVDSSGNQEITIRIIQAKNLPNEDVVGKSDPFVVVQAGGKKYQTSIIKGKENPVWNDDVVISGKNLFEKIKDLHFDVYDYDRWTKNDHLGHFEIHFASDLTDCETPALWYGLTDKKGDKVPNAEVQVQIQIRSDTDVVQARNYTHVLQFTVKSGRDLQNMDWLDKGDPYVSVEVGRQVYKTTAVKNSKKPTWNQSLYLFVDTDTQKDYQLVVSVLDKDLHNDDHIGTGYLPIKEIYDSPQRTFDDFINLQERVINLDKGLRDVPLAEAGSKSNLITSHCGKLDISAKLIPRRDIERNFYEDLLKYFDLNGDGKLQKNEVQQMLLYLEITQSAPEFMKKFDDNYDDYLTKEEIIKMLRDAKFQESDDSSKFILYHLKQDPNFDPFASKLMEGFFREDLSDATASKTIYVRSRKTGVVVAEHIPGYIHFALNLMYDNVAGQLLTETKSVQRVLHKMSRDKGKEYDHKASRSEIPSFIAQHNLDTSILEKDLKDFETFNDFFARAIKFEECRPMFNDETAIVSPADCRMMVFNNVLDSTKVWIKGDKFTVDRLLDTRKSAAPAFDGGAFCIARLAPQDYHRWHWPVSGTVTKITHCEGALYTVNPIAINQNVNVYTENKRAIIEMDTEHHGKMVMFVVAAAMVGSYILFQQGHTPLIEGQKVERGQVAGEFRFGGSTILLLFERKKVEWKEDLVSSSEEKLETLIDVRDTIGGVVGKTNISNIVKQFSD